MKNTEVILKLYHSTTQKPKIIESGKLKVNRRFNFQKYLVFLLQQGYEMKEPYQLKGNYPGSNGLQAPFMGHGIYCYGTFKEAEKHQANCQVVEISYSEQSSKLNLDDDKTLYDILESLSEIEEIIDTNISEEARWGWKHLIVLLKNCLLEEFVESGPAVGLIIYVLLYFKKIKVSDLLIRSFYDKIGVVGKPKTKKIYFLISNTDKIEEIF